MAIRGKLGAFGMADVLQLVAHQGKSGVLTFATDSKTVSVTFGRGGIVGAESPTRQRGHLLGTLLRRSGAISQEQLDAALGAQQGTQRRLGEILVTEGAITAEVLSAFARLQTAETLYELFEWTEGTYDFEAKDPAPTLLAEPLATEAVLLDGFRRRDEWPRLRERIRSDTWVFLRTGEIGEVQVVSAPAVESDFELGLSDELKPGAIGASERLVFDLIDGKRSIARLVELSRIGEFETWTSLAALWDANLVAPKDTKAEAAPGPAPRILARYQRITAAFCLIAFVATAFAVAGIVRRRAPTESALPAAETFKRVRTAIEEHHRRTGRYPAMAELPESVRPGDAETWVYRITDEGYVLLPPL